MITKYGHKAASNLNKRREGADLDGKRLLLHMLYPVSRLVSVSIVGNTMEQQIYFVGRCVGGSASTLRIIPSRPESKCRLRFSALKYEHFDLSYLMPYFLSELIQLSKCELVSALTEF